MTTFAFLLFDHPIAVKQKARAIKAIKRKKVEKHANLSSILMTASLAVFYTCTPFNGRTSLISTPLTSFVILDDKVSKI